jgi:hypothetical protein
MIVPSPCSRSSACLAACLLLVASLARAQVVFDNGAANTLNMPTGDPPVAVQVRDSTGGGATSLTVEDGANIGGGSGASVALLGQSVFVMTGGTASGDLTVTDTAEATISGGSFGDDLSIAGSGEVTLSVATFDDVNVVDNGILNIEADAEIGGDASFQGMSQLNMSGGALPNEVLLLVSSSALFTGGEVGDVLIVADSAQVEVQSAEINAIEVEGNTVTRIFDGEIGEVFATGIANEGGTDGSSRVDIFGGQFGPIAAIAGSPSFTTAVNISDGTFEEGIAARGPGAKVHFNGGTLESFDARELEASNLGELTVNGGTGTEVDVTASIGGKIDINQLDADSLNIRSFGGLVTINGGQAESLSIESDRGDVAWLGGEFDSVNIEALFSSNVTIVGSNFVVNGVPFSGGDIVAPSGDISGTLADGSTFSALFTRQFEPANRVATIRLVNVPEPASVAFVVTGIFGLGAICQRAKRRC